MRRYNSSGVMTLYTLSVLSFGAPVSYISSFLTTIMDLHSKKDALKLAEETISQETFTALFKYMSPFCRRRDVLQTLLLSGCSEMMRTSESVHVNTDKRVSHPIQVSVYCYEVHKI